MLRRKRKRAKLKKHSVKRDNKMKIFPRDNLFGEFAVPPDRSITHRAIMIGALAKGKTTIINPFICQDTQSMISCVKKLGAKVSVKKEYIEIVVTPSTMREAICNAIVHRDYMGVHTQMKVYDDCIMLWNEDKLPEGINQEKLFAEHASQPRNRNIANAFYKAGFIETWGRGINKIRQGLKKMGLPEPKIENHVSGTLIIIYRNGGVNGTNDTNNVGNKCREHVGNKAY